MYACGEFSRMCFASSMPSMSGNVSAVVTRSTMPVSSCFFASAPFSHCSTTAFGSSAPSTCAIILRATFEPSTTMTRGSSLEMWRVSGASMA